MFFLVSKKRINSIIDVLKAAAAGRRDERVVLHSRGKFNGLEAAVNNTISVLGARIAELENDLSRYQIILNSMVEGVIVIDKEARIISVNPTIEAIFDISRSAANGKFFLEAIRNNDIADIVSNVLKDGKTVSCEVALVWPVKRNLVVNASAIVEKADIKGCLLVVHDITEIRRLEVMRRDFVANVSHELKTPLTSIKGFVETLIDGAIDDKENRSHFLEIIRQHSQRLDNLINDLLDLSYIESGEIKLNNTQFKLKDLLSQIISGFKSVLAKSKIEIVNQVPEDVNLDADKDKIGQVLTNLIGNAIKFNKSGGSIDVYVIDLGQKIKVVVEDTGIGIPQKDIPRIFERFYRVDKARSRDMGGTGLGLSIVKHIIELHNGSVGVESQEGLGSKFWFILPK